MKQVLLIILCVIAVSATFAQNKDLQTIKQILNKQTLAWNRGDIKSFMSAYWHSDSLLFIGKNGPKYGFKTTLENYKKSYPDTATMGQLQFDLLETNRLCRQYFFVAGKWHLHRTIGNVEGYFTLIFKKIKGSWFIVTDHSS